MNKQQGCRHSIRLQNYDYSSPGSYFITICTRQHECLFGEIVRDKMQLNKYGQIVQQQWEEIPCRFPDVKVAMNVVMPNHTHAIITTVGAPLAGAFQNDDPDSVLNSETEIGSTRATARVAPTLGNIVGAYKSLCARHCLQWIKQHRSGRQLGKLWQRNYYEHVIRNQSDYDRIAEYIQNNPQQWALDSLNPDNLQFRQ